MFDEIAKIVGISGILISLIAWLGKSIVSQFLKKELEDYKAQATRELTEYKSDLENKAYEHHIRFEWLHKKRALLIEDIFEDLNSANQKILEKYESYFPAMDTIVSDVAITDIKEIVTSYISKVRSHPLYFSEDLVAMLVATGNKLKEACKALQFEDIRRKVQDGDELSISERILLETKTIQYQMEMDQDFSKPINDVLSGTQIEINESRISAGDSLEALATEFRKILGSS